MTASCRKIYEQRIADPNTPEKLRKFYKRLMQEPDTKTPEKGQEPLAFVRFLEILEKETIWTHTQ